MSRYIILTLLVLLGLSITFNILQLSSEETITEVVTHDTVRIRYPVAHDTVMLTRTISVNVTAPNVCDVCDSDSNIVLLAEQKHYIDSLYECWVSGIDPQLDSINVFRRNTIRTITKTVTQYKPLPSLPGKNIELGGFAAAYSSFDMDNISMQAGLSVSRNNLNLKVGYNLGSRNYPFLGIEYKIK
jgi:hypothetical protein